ncbi:MAG: NTP transferase domain-containing protein [Clostridia bacterium]|nr:NTP transferase domain-containing protein [Clostridia bacterium]
MTLVILAAGMGSRYGGLKQIDPITKNGEFIIDFSVFDALRSGFDKVVFVIKEENLEAFRESVGKRFEDKIEVKYVFQKLDDLPEGFKVPEGRAKPWGTAHALLAARNEVKDAFAVINADDFYGYNAYKLLAEHFANGGAQKSGDYCMVGYVLSNTLTENGTVSRGVCVTNESGELTEVNERTKIEKQGDVAVSVESDGTYTIPLDAVVSMNCWGFTPDIFEGVSAGFAKFLSQPHADEMKCEYYLPFAVTELMEAGKCTVKVYRSEDSWYGVTYAEDKEKVKTSIAALMDGLRYPEKLS